MATDEQTFNFIAGLFSIYELVVAYGAERGKTMLRISCAFVCVVAIVFVVLRSASIVVALLYYTCSRLYARIVLLQQQRERERHFLCIPDSWRRGRQIFGIDRIGARQKIIS